MVILLGNEVALLVDAEIAPGSKPSVTVLALEGLLLRVGPDVVEKVAPLSKRLATAGELTRMRGLFLVELHVSEITILSAKRLTTVSIGTNKAISLVVGSLVLLKMLLLHELTAALRNLAQEYLGSI